MKTVVDKHPLICYLMSIDRGAFRQEYRTTPQGAAKPCEKGASAEAYAVAGILLAIQRISVLLSQKCGALSTKQNTGLFCCVGR